MSRREDRDASDALPRRGGLRVICRWAKAATVLALAAGLSTCAATPPAAQPTCAGSGPVAVLVIGDSWASKGRLDEGGAAAGTGQFCSLGFSGQRTSQIAAALRAARPNIRARTVVLVAGVNDVAQHAGPKAYANGIEDLKKEAAVLSDDVRVLEIPAAKSPIHAQSLQGRARQTVQRFVHDRGRANVLSHYRAAVRADIDFDAFIPAYKGNEHRYSDGVHLTDDEYSRLGAYLRRAVENGPPPHPST